MQAPLDIRYAGVNIGRAQEVRTAEGEATFFLPGKEPMPVGTVLRLRTSTGETPARVMRAIESTDPAICGMEVRLVGDEEAVAAEVIPPPAPAKPKPSPPPPAPVQPAPSPAPPAPVVQPAASTPTQPYGVAAVAGEADKLPAAAAPEPESSAVPEAVPVAVGSSLTGALTKATADTDPADVPTPPPPALPTTAAAVAPTRRHEASDDLDIVISNTPPPISPASVVPVVAPFEGDPTPPPPPAEAAAPAAEVASEGSQASGGTNGNGNGGEEAPANATSPTTEQLPTARAISGPSSRRKTKRRRST
jgi:hypothetical protein